MDFKELAVKAEKSNFWLWFLNQVMSNMIPFNKPHGLKITKITKNRLETVLPLKRKNQNHLKGIHACALATIGEFTAGALLVSRLDPKKYRMILKELKVNYFYQAKSDVNASFDLNEDYYQNEIVIKIEEQNILELPLIVQIFDLSQNHICDVQSYWQIKKWDLVKTKIN